MKLSRKLSARFCKQGSWQRACSLVIMAVLLIVWSRTLLAQQNNDEGASAENDQKVDLKLDKVQVRANPRHFVKALAQDQIHLWSSPLSLSRNQAPFLVGTAAATAMLIAGDNSIERHIGTTKTKTSTALSNAGIALFAGSAGAFYVGGLIKHNEHARETGLLTGEAAIDALAVNSVLQAAFGRARPDERNAGDFFAGGSSFPSSHSAVAWASASVIAHEYPGWGTKTLSYGLASLVSLSRVSGRKHFPSDVLVGSGLGWFIGSEIYRKHHNEDLPGASYGTFVRDVDRVPNPMRQASTYVALDSWVYAALDRLASLGYAPTGFMNMRPWTRMECARLLGQADQDSLESDTSAMSLYRNLQYEFARETEVLNGERNLRANIDSIYTRAYVISGTPLTDGMHFGQTVTNDYGRPYQRGFNFISGFSGKAEAGPVAVYVRGEYQHAPSAPPISESVRTSTALVDGLPLQPQTSLTSVNRLRLLDAYAATNLLGWQMSFGKQSIWWGPGGSGDLMFSNNAEPITMLRLTSTTPFKLPSLLGWLGPMRSDSFIGQLDGYNFLRLGPSFVLTGSYDHMIDPQPYIWGQKLSLQPTRNLQLGVSITTVFAGFGRPLTTRTFVHTFSSRGNAQADEPGDRRTGFDFSYRIPGLRNWLILYNGSMAEDEPNPIAYPRRSAMNPGIYFPQIPGIRKLDLHVEAGYTNLPNDYWAARFYKNTHYAGGYTNYGQIMASWLGPEASGYQAWSNYWRSGQSKIQFGYRKQTVDKAYIGGGSLQDFYCRYDVLVERDITVSASAQYERWRFPTLANAPQADFAVSMQIMYKPFWSTRRKQ